MKHLILGNSSRVLWVEIFLAQIRYRYFPHAVFETSFLKNEYQIRLISKFIYLS
jgi:hypothetical protein